MYGLFTHGKDSVLKINSRDSLFNTFIFAYNSYQQYKFLHETGDRATLDKKIQISTDDDAILVFDYHEEAKIAESAHKTIIINAGMESSYVFQINIHGTIISPYPADKKCIFFSDATFDKVDATEVNCLPLAWPWFMITQIEDMASIKNTASSINTIRDFNSPRLFNFCSLIGFERPERNILVNKLTSINNKNFVLQYNGNTLAKDPIGDIKYSLPKYNSYQQFDILDAQTEFYTMSTSIPIELYNNSNFILVVECTILDHLDIHVTEKITKALITGIPFIVVATPLFLKRLQEFGFKTYNTVWDESYDTVPFYEDRMDAVVNLINQLDSFDWPAHANELEAIANHNKLNFLNLQKYKVAAFEQFDKYIYDVL